MFLVLLKIKNKIYFENLDTHSDMVEFIDTVETKYGEIEYGKSIVVTGSEFHIDEIINMIEEKYYLHIVGRKIDEKVYKDLLSMLKNLNTSVKITYGIEFEDENIEPTTAYAEMPAENTDHTQNFLIDEKTVDNYSQQVYSLGIYRFDTGVTISLVEKSGYDSSRSFIQHFENLDEIMSVFEGLKHDFMELIDSEDDCSFTITNNLYEVNTYIEAKFSLMMWKNIQKIKYINGRYKKIELPDRVEYETGEYMTASEVIKKLRISDQTLANWRRSGLIEFKKISNRKYLYITDNINHIFKNGIDSSGVTTKPKTHTIDKLEKTNLINYEYEILKILRPFAFKIPEYKYRQQNFFLNFGNVGISSSPQVMINNEFQLIDFIKKSVIKETPQQLYEYLLDVFRSGKEPRVDTSRKIQPEFSKLYLNKLYDKNYLS